jgi:serine/threonine-protein kinase
MARVYRAFDHTLQREVALKIIHNATQQADFVERFRLEAHTLANLRHPYIVQIYDYGQHDDHSFIVQQLQPGPTLEQELANLAAQGRFMECGAVEQVIAQLASALDYAHSCNIIHRDLKPSNIIRNERGDVVLTDFGIVKGLTGPIAKTQTGVVLGTPAYLSPEQARGLPSLSSTSDIYTLGVILFELLTGQVPFNDPLPMEVLLGHILQPPPSPRVLRPDLPPGVERVVLKALAKDPTERYATAGALAHALHTAWASVVRHSIHSQPTAANPMPSLASMLSVPVASRTLGASPFSPAPAQARQPIRRRYLRAGFSFMTLPVLLAMVVALFWVDIPQGNLLGTMPTASPTFRQLARADGLDTATRAPLPTSTSVLSPTSTSALPPTSTFALPPTSTSVPHTDTPAQPPADAPVPPPEPQVPPTNVPEPAPTSPPAPPPADAPAPPPEPQPAVEAPAPAAPQPTAVEPDF